MVIRDESGPAEIEVDSRSDGRKNPASSTSPVTVITRAASSAVTRTKCAGRLAIMPCSGRSTVPRLLWVSGTVSRPGGPFESRPQRTIHSSKPRSQPMPPRSDGLTNAGCTGPRTGDRQPSECSP